MGAPIDAAEAIFSAIVIPQLREIVGPTVFEAWFGCLGLDRVENGVVHMTVPTRFLCSWLVQHHSKTISAAVAAGFPEVSTSIGVRSSARVARVAARAIPHPALRSPIEERVAALVVQPPAVPAAPAAEAVTIGSPLDARMTFETFQVGQSNLLVHSAAEQVAAAMPGEEPQFNPLYIHGQVGLGKTHLLQAIAHASDRSGRRVLYLTAEKFMYGFVLALKAQTALAFNERLRGIDVLVIDDVQFLQGKSIQTEFCHTINAFIEARKQIVIAADRPPADLESLEERVRSRLSGGLVVEIGALDEALRVRMLESRIAAVRANMPTFDVPPAVIAYVASVIQTNGRDLDGAINRLVAHASLLRAPLTIALAEAAIRDLVRVREPKRIKIEEIQRLVAIHFNVPRSDMLSARRTANVVRPRQVAMYLSKVLTLRSLPEIGRRFGGRDHTTVLSSIRKICRLIDEDTSLSEQITGLRQMLEA